MISKKTFEAYIELTKPRIMTLVLITTVIGYYLGGTGMGSWTVLFFLILGVIGTCGGASVINQFLEREYDSKMLRTRNRPIPTGVIKPHQALNFGIILSLAGIFILYTQVNMLTAFLSLLTSFLYIMVYTPLKRVSWLNTTVGAVPGALPPLGGWAAASGTLTFDAGILFLILFIWQHPHFYSIAWMCKEDYERGGFIMLPSVDETGKRTFAQIFWSSIILIPVSLIPVFTGLTGLYYAIGAIISGLFLFKISMEFIKIHSMDNAKKLLKATVYYLPILLILIVVDARF
ncbi:MAG: heme o synthase [Candidatus Omnitrophica bacterium]|nr:heme o synthase [Candidatus Omnitrophota bacterium]